ncbi:MAG: hypothetical protein IPO02_00410 [Bacteroidetes bacterium]|nr:hypothetical protein [Bacteroidota bacterium]
MENPFEILLEKLNRIEKLLRELTEKNVHGSTTCPMKEMDECHRRWCHYYLYHITSSIYQLRRNVKPIPLVKKVNFYTFSKGDVV